MMGWFWNMEGFLLNAVMFNYGRRFKWVGVLY